MYANCETIIGVHQNFETFSSLIVQNWELWNRNGHPSKNKDKKILLYILLINALEET